MADVSVLLPDGSQETYSNVETVTLDSAAGDGTQEVFVSQRLIQNQLQTDWLQEDESAVDFLKNKPFGDIPANLAETEVAFNQVADFPNTYGAVCDGRELLLGKSYVVKWGEAEYTCMCKELGGSADLYLGNPTKLFLPQGVDTGEPFYVAWNGEKLAFQTDQTDATRIIGITPVNAVKKLDKKYLPDEAATKEYVAQEIAKIEVSGGSSISKGETVFAEQTLEFTSQDGAYSIELETDKFALVNGEKYIVVWDGNPHECECSTVNTGSYNLEFVGNAALGGFGEDTGEPFIVGTVSNSDATEIYLCLIATNDTTATHIVAIYKGVESAGGVSSWSDLTDKPFGEETTVIFEGVFQETLMDTDGDGIGDEWSSDVFVEDTSSATLEVGKSYVLTWDGEEYICECFSLGGSIPCIGNPAVGGGSSNGCPVAIVRDVSGAATGMMIWAAMVLAHEDGINESGTHTCKIELADVTHLDNKYLDFMEQQETVETEVLSETTFETTEIYYDGAEFALSLGSLYRVDFDGIEYMSVAKDHNGTVFIGNGSLALLGVGAGEPFVAFINPNASLSRIVVAESGAHTISIARVVGGNYTVNPEYIPAPPEFDLTAMGLPAIPLDGTQVSIECDTSELRAAAEKGVIKTVLAVNIPGAGSVSVKTIVPMGYLAATGTYAYCGLIEMNGSVFALSFSVTNSGIFSKAIPLATASG